MTDIYFCYRASERIAIGPFPSLAAARRLAATNGVVVQYPPKGVEVIDPAGYTEPVSLTTTWNAETGELLDKKPFEFVPTGLVIHGMPTLEQWIEFGQVLVGAASHIQWAIGDWINHGEKRHDWGEKYQQALDAFHLEYQYLCNLSYVAREFEISRRRENLSISHHQEVAALPRPLQDELLDQAEAEQLSVRELREEKHRATGTPMRGSEMDRFEGNFDQAVNWLADMKFKYGWQKRIRIVIFEA